MINTDKNLILIKGEDQTSQIKSWNYENGKYNITFLSGKTYTYRFCPDEALSLAKRLEVHYTPKHGSWLDIAEIELSALGRQCLSKRRIGNIGDLNSELKSWYVDRNSKQNGVDWQFTTADARIKLKRLYPVIK